MPEERKCSPTGLEGTWPQTSGLQNLRKHTFVAPGHLLYGTWLQQPLRAATPAQHSKRTYPMIFLGYMHNPTTYILASLLRTSGLGEANRLGWWSTAPACPGLRICSGRVTLNAKTGGVPGKLGQVSHPACQASTQPETGSQDCLANEATEAQRCWSSAQGHAQVEQEADGGTCSPGNPWDVGLPPSTQAEGGIFWPEHKGVGVMKTIIAARERKPSINSFKLK